ncbi:MAG TPA: SDR family oxidoreductase [Acidobacteriota bacterium]|nr:SDR family oxidoreductase [Acidobacteriota bacterium]
MELRDRVAIITGAASGLGRQLALDLAGMGVSLALADRDAERLRETQAETVQLGSSALELETDVTEETQCAALVNRTIEEFGSLDLLILCAGVSMWAPFDGITDLTIFRKLMEINFLGAVNCVHAALPELRKSRGRIVAISSLQGLLGIPNHTGYASSKHALNGFLQTLEYELGEEIGITNVMPGWITGTNLRANAFTATGRHSDSKRSSFSVPVEECSRRVIRAIEGDKKFIFVPSKLRFVPLIRMFAPRWLKAKIIRAVEKQK